MGAMSSIACDAEQRLSGRYPIPSSHLDTETCLFEKCRNSAELSSAQSVKSALPDK
jgi:hypothetical protein